MRCDRRRHLLIFVICFWLVSLLQHVRSFSVDHTRSEGDEVTYLTLAREMGWDLSHYTTMDDPEVREFPTKIYRLPLFVHPPLFPLILKFGQLCGNPVMFGLVFSNLSMGLLLVCTRRRMVLLDTPIEWSLASFVAIVCCPLLWFSTTRLHTDGLLGIYSACGFIMLIDAFESRSNLKAMVSGALFVAALNLRFNAITVLPMLALTQAYYLYRLAVLRRLETNALQLRVLPVILDRRNWYVFAIVVSLIATLGMQHYYRILSTYGTLSPAEFNEASPDQGDFSPLLKAVSQRTHWHMAGYLLSVFPVLIIFLTPWPYRTMWKDLRNGSWEPLFPFLFLYFFAVTFIVLHEQMRYFAAVTVFLYLGIPRLLSDSSQVPRTVMFFLSVPTLLLMLTTGFFCTIVFDRSPVIFPTLFHFIPFLEDFYL